MRTHEHVQLPSGAAAILGQRAGFGESQPLSGGLFTAGTTPLLSAMMGGLAQHGAAGGAGGAGGGGIVGVAGGAEPLGAAGLSHASIAALVLAQAQASALGANGMQQQIILAALQAAAAGSASGTSYQNGHHEHDDMEEDSDPDREMRYDDRWSNGGSHGVDRGLVALGGADALGGFSRPRRLDKSEVKKAKRAVYIALREFVDQDMTEPVDMRMHSIVSQLKQLQRNEAPAGNAKEWVACDDCQKWRKVPRGFHVDKDKNFYCNMLPKMSCEMKEEEWGKENDNSFIDAEWVLFSWDRFKRELAREKDKLVAAIRLVERSKTNGNWTRFSPHQQPSLGDPLSPMNPEQDGRRMSEEQSASTESTSAELPEQLGVECAGNGGVQEPFAPANAPCAAVSAAVEKAALLVRTQMECISKWKVDDNVEAKDSTGRWYRAQVRGVSYTGRQVKINFGAWDSKWDEWIRIKEGRVRDIQFPEALRIKVDGTPIWPKDKKKKDVDEMEMEEVDEGERASATPAKLTREEQRSMERMRRLEEEEKRRRKKEEREKAGPSAYKIFIMEESARLMKEQKGLKMIEANQLAREEWKKRTLVVPEIPMGIIIGSAHQLYACIDEETVQDVAAKLKVDAQKLLSMNVAVYPGMKMKDKLMEGTLLKLPLREGSGDSEKTIKVMCKVQAVKNILMFSMKENETIMALKKRVWGKENIKVGLQTVVFSGQRLEDQHTLADYNITDETLVVIHVGSQTHAVDNSKGAQEIEYDSSWMLSPAGKRFMETKEGLAWLKTKAGLEWQKQKKEDEREERKEAVRESKITQEAEPGAALKKFNLWFKTETALLREKHPHMSQKMASDTARWTWKVYAGPSTYKHRAEFAKMPSVVSWNTNNLNRKLESAEAEVDVGFPSAEGESATGKSKKRRDVVASETISSLVKANAFSTSYDWSYRENHLSRTAKKAARISLTTDTLDLITCGLEGLDDRYDGSGWTTWKKKDTGDGKKKKLNKDGTERKPRQTQARQPKAPADPLALPKAAGSNVPRWYKGMPRCPDLLLPKDEDIPDPESNTAGEGGAAGESQDQTVANSGSQAESSTTEPKMNNVSSREEKKLLAQMQLFQKLELERLIKKSVNDASECAKPECDVKVEQEQGPDEKPDAQMEPAFSSNTSNVETGCCPKTSCDAAIEKTAQECTGSLSTITGASGRTEEPSSTALKGAESGASTDSPNGDDDGNSATGSALLPLPTSAQLQAANLAPPEGDYSFFKLPYAAVRHKFQKEFEDYACIDDSSEFPTPYVPINRNEYVDEEAACRLPLHEGKNICQCIYVPGTPETACGEESNCLLRDIYIECGDRCPCGSHCLNKRLRKRQWAKCSLFLASNGRGWALRNDHDLVTGQLVMEYVGEVITGEEVDMRMTEYKGKRHTYLLKLNTDEFIDSTRKGNLARFINHCCEPNCVMQKWNVGGVQRVGLFAKYPIPAGSELTFDYDMEFYGSEDVKCLCGAPKCRGTLGKKADECDKDKIKVAKSGPAAARKSSGERGVAKKSGVQLASSSQEGKKQIGTNTNRGSGAANIEQKTTGVKRKQEEAGEGEDDDFFSSLPPREKKKQIEMMKKVMGGGK